MKAVKKAYFGDLPLVIWPDLVGSNTVTVLVLKQCRFFVLEVVK